MANWTSERASPLRVCMAVNNFEVGGLEKVVLSLMHHLDPAAFTLSVVCLDGEGALFSQLNVPPERILVCKKDPWLKLGGFAVDPRLLLSLRQFFARHQVDIVHAHNLAPLVFTGLAARMLRKRPVIVYSEHNQIYRADDRARNRFRQYIRLADHVIAVSRALGDALAPLCDRPTTVLPNGIDGAPFFAADGKPVRAAAGIRDDEFVVGTAVVFREQKGLPYFIEAARLALAAEPALRFVVAGDGPLREQIHALAAQANLRDRLVFLGYRADMPAVLRSFDLYVLPSLWEGLPLALLEALAAGKPVVATAVGGSPEVINEGENGFLVPPRDPRALADAIVRVARDEAFRASAPARNVDRFKTLFSLDAMVSAHVKLFRTLALTPPRSLLADALAFVPRS